MSAEVYKSFIMVKSDLQLNLKVVMNNRVPTVRESQGILSESGKVRENSEGQGKFREF